MTDINYILVQAGRAIRDLDANHPLLESINECIVDQLYGKVDVVKPEVVLADILSAMPSNRNRTSHCLYSAGITSLEDLLSKTKNDIYKLPRLGRDSLDNLRMALRKFDLKLKGDF